MTRDGKWLISANQTFNTLSLVDLSSDSVLQELPCGTRPAGLALSPDEATLLATTQFAGDVHRYLLAEGRLEPAGALHLGGEPVGALIDRLGASAYVALEAAEEVAVIDLAA